MKSIYFLLIVFLGFNSAIAQFGPQQIISSTALAASRSIPYDLNLDGYTDVISGSTDIGWFQNIDGLGTFSSEIMISNIGPDVLELFDLDNDGDMDILYKTTTNNTIAWLENIDGFGEFGAENIVSQTTYPYKISAADLDGDGDKDVLAILFGASDDEDLVWYENLDGQGTFSTEKHITTNSFEGGSSIVTFDIDGDNDQDIITSYGNGADKIVWYENIDGQGNFATDQEIYQFQFAQSDWTHVINITPTDINGDGKTDLLFDTENADTSDLIYWLENIDGQGSFSEPQLIHVKETNLGSLRSYDLDSDGDNDVLVSFYWGADTSISWFENTNGQGQFGGKRIISTNVARARDATAADINGDGDIDVISASYTDSKIAWYENRILGVSEKIEQKFTLFPNPTQNNVTIQTKQNIQSIELFNSLGELLKTIEKTKIILLSDCASGIYFAKITDLEGNSETHKIIKL